MIRMENDEMDRDLEDARSYLGCTRLTVERSRHGTACTTALWIMDGTRQIASATRLGEPFPRGGSEMRWSACTLHRGGIVADEVYVSTLLDALGHIMRRTKDVDYVDLEKEAWNKRMGTKGIDGPVSAV